MDVFHLDLALLCALPAYRAHSSDGDNRSGTDTAACRKCREDPTLPASNPSSNGQIDFRSRGPRFP